MTTIDDFNFDELIDAPTRLRATAAALALVLAGERPSLSRVARMAGVSRQGLHEHHKPLVLFVEQLRAQWTPREDTPAAQKDAEIEGLRAELRKERALRKEAEAGRDRALHHLELTDATLSAIKRASNVSALPRRDSRPD